MELTLVPITKPENVNVILGQAHFIKTIEDLHEALFDAVPHVRFGLAFCEGSGARLVRWSGTDETLIGLAQQNAMAIGAGHCFIILLGEGFYPINVLTTLKLVPEVCRIFCATSNPVEVIVARTDQGRGILGVIDGEPPVRIEGDAEIASRKELLRQLGYKQ